MAEALPTYLLFFFRIFNSCESAKELHNQVEATKNQREREREKKATRFGFVGLEDLRLDNEVKIIAGRVCTCTV